MPDKVAVFIVSYNMPEKADALFEFIECKSCWPISIYLIDNGSDIQPPAVHSNVLMAHNMQTTAGWLEGLRAAKRSGENYLAYCFAITSADFPETTGDPITPLAELLQKDCNAVGVHPALTKDSTTSWTHLITRGGDQPRRTFMLDNIFSCFRADWFDSIGWFDPNMRYAWGIDLETCWIARAQGRSLWVHEGVQIRKITNIGYSLNRMNMSADERNRLAGDNMRFYLSQKYGDNWWQRMTRENVQEDWL